MRVVGAVGARDLDPGVLARHDLTECIVLHGFLHHQRHVMRGRVHVASPLIKVQAVRILKKRSRAAKLFCALVHCLHKRGLGIFGLGVDLFAHIFGKHGSSVVARGNHQAAQDLFHGELVAFEQAGGRVAHGGSSVAHRDLLVHLAILYGQNRGHDLGDRRDLDLLVGAAGVIDGAVLAHDDRVGGIDVGQILGRDAADVGSLATNGIGRKHLGASDGWCACNKGEGAGNTGGQLRRTLYKRTEGLHRFRFRRGGFF